MNSQFSQKREALEQTSLYRAESIAVNAPVEPARRNRDFADKYGQ